MKKQYITPKMTVVNIDATELCAVSFGDGETDVMHSKGIYVLDDEYED